MAEVVDYVVVGLGALGSATAYQLARRGHRVVGVERFALGHDRGASHDTSRILRHSYHTPAYVRLTREAYADWAALEADCGEPLVTVVGGIDLFPPGAAIPLADYERSLVAEGIEHEVLDVATIGQRWPQLVLPDATVGLFQARGAIVPAGRGTAVLQRLARASGAVLRDHASVSALHDRGEAGVEVTAGGTTYSCSGVVLCTDAWTNRLLAHLDAELPLTTTLEQVTYFAPPDPTAFQPGRLPLWIWMDEPSFYGFPCYGEATVKAAQDCGGPVVDPDDRTRDPDHGMEERLAAHLARMLPGSGPPVRSLRCQYTLTPDRDFVVDAVPGHPAVWVGLGAAHGFKFAPTLGRILADLVTTGATASDISAFRWDRPALLDPDFEPNWMV
ncbi:MAG TPA: N-methyl-L-tryptophan oxidase [Nocardioides sp.]|uniref:N-methyl-L-tryptophan oxidase n=1 Tax=Nocardioides sp. TaxID=35761 RepID=UPI002BA5C1AE|nr:N-methyl-L-tryptophan oxidase [Nocardioides sp.]HQR28364.1 N-methyl-L-tryptophan oxidase [Nocardioides sp.]